MTEIRIEDLDDKPRKIIRALGYINNALWEMDFTVTKDDKGVDHNLCAAKSVLRAQAKDIARKHAGDKLDDVVRFVDKAGRIITYLVINEWAQA